MAVEDNKALDAKPPGLFPVDRLLPVPANDVPAEGGRTFVREEGDGLEAEVDAFQRAQPCTRDDMDESRIEGGRIRSVQGFLGEGQDALYVDKVLRDGDLLGVFRPPAANVVRHAPPDGEDAVCGGETEFLAKNVLPVAAVVDEQETLPAERLYGHLRRPWMVEDNRIEVRDVHLTPDVARVEPHLGIVDEPTERTKRSWQMPEEETSDAAKDVPAITARERDACRPIGDNDAGAGIEATENRRALVVGSRREDDRDVEARVVEVVKKRAERDLDAAYARMREEEDQPRLRRHADLLANRRPRRCVRSVAATARASAVQP